MEERLTRIDVGVVKAKAGRGAGLNAEEFAVHAGYSYTAARALFREAGFPVIRGLVTWDDWVIYRRQQSGISRRPRKEAGPRMSPADRSDEPGPTRGLPTSLPPRAARLLRAVCSHK